jgi:hypothetical protein
VRCRWCDSSNERLYPEWRGYSTCTVRTPYSLPSTRIAHHPFTSTQRRKISWGLRHCLMRCRGHPSIIIDRSGKVDHHHGDPDASKVHQWRRVEGFRVLIHKQRVGGLSRNAWKERVVALTYAMPMRRRPSSHCHRFAAPREGEIGVACGSHLVTHIVGGGGLLPSPRSNQKETDTS